MVVVKVKGGYLSFDNAGRLVLDDKDNAIWFDSEGQAVDFMDEHDISEPHEFEDVDF